jgi:hypothetical protein
MIGEASRERLTPAGMVSQPWPRGSPVAAHPGMANLELASPVPANSVLANLGLANPVTASPVLANSGGPNLVVPGSGP